jgi:hypothetical protein
MATDNDNEPIIGDDAPPKRRPGPHAPGPTGVAPAAATVGLAAATAQRTASAPAADDPRARAAKRAMELREHLGNMDEGEDEFYIDPRVIPDGWSYEWKRHTTLGAEDPAYQVSIARKGWEAVPVSRHPEMMPDNYKGTTILRKGMILMERPAEITELAKAQELRKARQQVRQKEIQLHGAPAGDNSPFEATNKGNSLVKIGKSYEPMPIPKE